MTTESDFAKMAEILRKERDELGVKVHLAGMEVRDEWQELEEKWEQFSSNSKNFYKEVEPALGNIQAALNLLGEELKAGYKKIRDSL